MSPVKKSAKKAAATRSSSATKKAKKTGPTKRAAKPAAKGASSSRSVTPRGGEASDEVDTCFVISPFGGWFDNYHKEVFCPAIRAASLEPKRADDLFRSSNIVHDVWHMITEARVLLADLTGKNANVFYELGLAHAARKPVLLITENLDDVPFDLRALRVVEYEPRLPGWDRSLGARITESLLETLQSPEEFVLPTFIKTSSDTQVTVPEQELRFLQLEQEMQALRAQLRSQQLHSPGGMLPRAEAERRLDRYLREGRSPGEIVDRLAAEGVPRTWARRRVAERLDPELDESN